MKLQRREDGMTLIVSPLFFWLLVTVVVAVIALLWAEVYSVQSDFDKMSQQRDFWEDYTKTLLKRHEPENLRLIEAPKEFHA